MSSSERHLHQVYYRQILTIRTNHRVLLGAAQRGAILLHFAVLRTLCSCSKMILFYLKTCTPVKGPPWSTAWTKKGRKIGFQSYFKSCNVLHDWKIHLLMFLSSYNVLWPCKMAFWEVALQGKWPTRGDFSWRMVIFPGSSGVDTARLADTNGPKTVQIGPTWTILVHFGLVNAGRPFVRAACLQSETAPEKLLNRYEKRFEKREKRSEKRSETCLKIC